MTTPIEPKKQVTFEATARLHEWLIKSKSRSTQAFGGGDDGGSGEGDRAAADGPGEGS